MASSTEHKADTGDQAARGRAAFIQAWALEQLRARPGIELILPATRTSGPSRRWSPAAST